MNTASEKKRSIYVLMTRTGTGPAIVIRLFSRMEYNHASISGDAALNQLYSFCRNYTYVPFPASFNKEFIGEGTFGKFPVIPCEIYEIPLTEEQYSHFQCMIDHFITCRSLYSYSVIGLLRVKMQIESELRNKFVCSQFVAYVLEECGVKLDKDSSLYSPDDLRYLPDAKLIYRGELNRYYHEQNEKLSYMPMVSAV